jgi:hypothetical protein
VPPIAGTEPKEDNLDRYRRFEQQYPELGEEIDEILQQPVEVASKALLELVLRLGRGKLTPKHLEQARLVQTRFDWN